MANELTVETSRNSSKVMVAIDGGEYSSYALKWALQNLDDKLKHGVLLFICSSMHFGLWKLKMRAILIQQGCEKALVGKSKKPSSMIDTQFEELDLKAISAIQLCLSDEVLHKVAKEETTAELWLKLESLYMTKSVTNRLLLKSKLHDLKLQEAVDMLTSIQDNQKKCADSILSKAKEICAKQGIDAEAVSMVGNPKDAICEAVQKHDCTLLVVGSRSRGAIGRTFLGSVSNHCVHHAKCPVLVVKSEHPLCSP